MSGFEFQYRLNGAPPTVRRVPIKALQSLSRGDMINLEGREADLAVGTDTALLGIALETKGGAETTTCIEVIVDGDAVYATQDPEARQRGDWLEVGGETGTQVVSAGPAEQLLVIADCSAAQPTLLRIRTGSHAWLAARPTGGEAGAQLNADIARAISGVIRRFIGRGPARAEAFFRRNVVVVVLASPLTPAEQSLALHGKEDTVRQMRLALQRTIRSELVDAVEELTGRRVVGFLSDSQLEPDLAAEVFVLDRPVSSDELAQAGSETPARKTRK